MRIAPVFSTGKLDRVDQRSVVEPVGKHGVTASDQCGNDSDIGHVAGTVKKGAFRTDKRSQCLFQLLMRLHMSADHVRAA